MSVVCGAGHAASEWGSLSTIIHSSVITRLMLTYVVRTSRLDPPDGTISYWLLLSGRLLRNNWHVFFGAWHIAVPPYTDKAPRRFKLLDDI